MIIEGEYTGLIEISEAQTFTIEQIMEVIVAALRDREYRYSDNLRTAAMMAPYLMTSAQWVEACTRLGINKNTAYYAISVVRKFQREVGEV